MKTKSAENLNEQKPPLIGDCVNFWMSIVTLTFAALIACVIAGQGASAVAFAIAIHAELKCFEHDERKCREYDERKSS